jgi:flagellar basal-body rod protein FlgB
VQILNSLFGNTIDNYQRALSRTAQRHSLLTGNLANVNTPGYKRKDVDFGITLDAATKTLSAEKGVVRTEAGSNRLDGNSVDLEREVMGLAETQLRFEALTDMTSNYFSGLKNVIREGK